MKSQGQVGEGESRRWVSPSLVSTGVGGSTKHLRTKSEECKVAGKRGGWRQAEAKSTMVDHGKEFGFPKSKKQWETTTDKF